MKTATTDPYAAWLETLTDEELENERYTIEMEWKTIGMGESEAIYKSNALSVESHRRFLARTTAWGVSDV